MIIVSGCDFSRNRSKILNMAREGEEVVLKFRKDGAFKLIPTEVENTPMNLTKALRDALKEVKQHRLGKIKLQSAEAFIDEYRNHSN